MKSLFLLLFLVSCTQSPSNVIVQNNIFSEYGIKDLENPYKIIVQKGDSLYGIVRKYDVPLQEIILINKLRAPYELKPGQNLILPRALYHEVTAGDTIEGVAKVYGTSKATIKEINNISDKLIVGNKIKIFGDIKKKQTKSDVKIIDSTKVEKLPLKTPKKIEKAAIKTEVNKPIIKKENISKPKELPKPNLKKQRNAVSKKTHSSNGKSNFIWPLKGSVISRFGPKEGGLYNDGVNIKAPEGEAIKAAEAGEVVYSGNELRGYGNLLLIKHNSGFLTTYAHKKRAIVKKGDRVERGQIIGFVGKTGNVNSPQLHFSIRKGRKAVDPSKYLK